MASRIKKFHLTAAFIVAVFSSFTSATEYNFRYKTLFSHLKYQDTIKYPDFKIGFFLISSSTGDVCKIKKASMSKKEHNQNFIIPVTQELPLPIDAHLRKVNPDIYIETVNSEPCDISFQIITNKIIEHKISHQDIHNYQLQIKAIMKDIGGIFSTFFMPDVLGVVLHMPLNETMLTSNLGNEFAVINQKVFINNDSLLKNDFFSLEKPIYKITPWLKNS